MRYCATLRAAAITQEAISLHYGVMAVLTRVRLYSEFPEDAGSRRELAKRRAKSRRDVRRAKPISSSD